MAQKASRKADASTAVGKKTAQKAGVLRTKGGTGRVASISIVNATTPKVETVTKAAPTPIKKVSAKTTLKTKVTKKEVVQRSKQTSATPQSTLLKDSERVAQTAQNIATTDPHTRKLRFPKISAPALTQERMRKVAYAGVVYVLVGVLSASYALADLSGVLTRGVDAPLAQLASTISTDTTTSNSGSSSGSSSGDTLTTTTDTTASTDTTTTDTQTNSTDSTGDAGDGTDAESTGTNAEETVTSTTQGTVTTDSVATDFTATTNLVMKPPIEVSFSSGQPLKEKVSLLIQVEQAEKVELAVRPLTALTFLYLGKANESSNADTEWRYVWDTKNMPNGTYELVVRVTNRYGAYASKPLAVAISNSVPVSTSGTSVASSTTSTVTSIEEEMASTLQTQEVEDEDEDKTGTTSIKTTTQSVVSSAQSGNTDDIVESDADKDLEPVALDPIEEEWKVKEIQLKEEVEDFKKQLLSLIERFAVAYRAQDSATQERVLDDIDTLKTQVVESIRAKALVRDQNYDRVAQELSGLVMQEVARIETREKMIIERVGDAVVADSDKDGVVDYDEIVLYNTDPQVADTDGDGFPDGAEIVGGFNPTDPKGEAPILFENPEDSGPEREDLLVVESIATQPADSGDIAAKLSGKGLPNSFVRLYIFSTPTIVTVQTGSDGSWSYVFDKELENGEHTAYVGVTDNAGRIVAKSKPFPFVKTAEAYTAANVAAAPAASAPVDKGMLDERLLLLIGAITLVMCGLALVALGSYFMRPRELVQINPQADAVA